MDAAQIETMLKMDNEGKTQAQIAEVIGVDASTVCRALAKFSDTRASARRRLIASADDAASHVLKAMKEAADRGDATAALEVLDRLDVLASKKHTGGGSGPQVVVVGAPPNAAINTNALPVFDAHVLPATTATE
jgi:hypothetical protein